MLQKSSGPPPLCAVHAWELQALLGILHVYLALFPDQAVLVLFFIKLPILKLYV